MHFCIVIKCNLQYPNLCCCCCCSFKTAKAAPVKNIERLAGTGKCSREDAMWPHFLSLHWTLIFGLQQLNPLAISSLGRFLLYLQSREVILLSGIAEAVKITSSFHHTHKILTKHMLNTGRWERERGPWHQNKCKAPFPFGSSQV